MNQTTYDVLPYEDYCFAATHPEQLQSVARLLGHQAPAFRQARVLELGCARGANLIPMALDLPNAHFVGIDLSSRQIDEGAALIARLSLPNISLRTCSIVDVDASFGTFDYVICHGVYSWVPAHVRAAIFDLCQRVLTPSGLAYVSYNTLPGWSLGRTLRDFLLLHVGAITDPLRKLVVARESLRALSAGLGGQSSPQAMALRAEAESLNGVPDGYLFHEYLEESNEPVYFRDFVREARTHGLDHLADADLTTLVPEAMPGVAADPIALEQSVDFFRSRRFRASILTRSGQPSPSLSSKRLSEFHLSTRAELAQDGTEAELRTMSPLAFTLHGKPFTLRDPLAKCVMVSLVEQERRPLAHADLIERAAHRVGSTANAARAFDLLPMVLEGRIELHAGPARYAAEASLRPVACPLARDQAMHGTVVTNRRHRQLDVEPFEQALIQLLDGTRGRTALAEALARTGEPNTPRRIEEGLEWLAANALLVS